MTKRIVKVSEKSRANLTGGSRKGVPNRVTKDLKDMILAALSASGGERYLVAQAAVNPKAFLSLLGRIIPVQVKAEHTGAEGKPLFDEVAAAARISAIMEAAQRRMAESGEG